MNTTYRVYSAPDGCSESYCGEFITLKDAQAYAETEPYGLDECLYDTARAAGHCGGMEAPTGGTEEDEPISWHGQSGVHCVIAVHYDD